VLGREVPVEGAQGDAGIGRDLLRGRRLDALGLEPRHGRAAERVAGPLAAHRLRVPGHGAEGTAAVTSA